MISGSWGTPGFDLEGLKGTDDREQSFSFDEEGCDVVEVDFFLRLETTSSSYSSS
jgi:hypothetical protein